MTRWFNNSIITIGRIRHERLLCLCQLIISKSINFHHAIGSGVWNIDVRRIFWDSQPWTWSKDLFHATLSGDRLSPVSVSGVRAGGNGLVVCHHSRPWWPSHWGASETQLNITWSTLRFHGHLRIDGSSSPECLGVWSAVRNAICEVNNSSGEFLTLKMTKDEGHGHNAILLHPIWSHF